MRKGFTLIEVVVAVFITVTVLAVLIKVISEDLRLLDKALSALKEIHILEQVAFQFQGEALEEGEVNGEWENRSYTVSIQKIEEYELPLYKVCVQIRKKQLCFLEAQGAKK